MGDGLMAEYNWLDSNDDDDDDDFGASSGRSDNALKEARSAAKKNARALREATKELEALRAQVHQSKVESAIREKGLNPKIARLAKDVPVDELDSFLDDYADVFGAAAPQADGDEGAANGLPPVTQETLDPNFLAMQRIQNGGANAQAPQVGNADMAARIAAANTPEELNMVLFGNPLGPKVY